VVRSRSASAFAACSIWLAMSARWASLVADASRSALRHASSRQEITIWMPKSSIHWPSY
jgi:hypothetical protein